MGNESIECYHKERRDTSLLRFDLFQNLDDFLCQSFVVKNPRSNFLS